MHTTSMFDTRLLREIRKLKREQYLDSVPKALNIKRHAFKSSKRFTTSLIWGSSNATL